MAVRKAGLGKGLDSLIPEHSVRRKVEKTEQKPEKNELLLKIADIEPNREQPRKHFDEDALLELSDSIKQFGIIQPLIVQKKEDSRGTQMACGKDGRVKRGSGYYQELYRSGNPGDFSDRKYSAGKFKSNRRSKSL